MMACSRNRSMPHLVFAAAHGGFEAYRSMPQHQEFCFVYGDSQLSVCSVCSVCTGDILSDICLLSSLLFALSTIPLPQSDGTKCNKETTRSTSDCLQWAVSEGIGERLTLTDASEEGRPGKGLERACNLCASHA